MRRIAYASPPLPGLAGRPKTYAAWPVWRDSAREEVRFAPLPKKEVARRWHKARRFDRQTHEAGKHGGAIGRTGLTVLYTLLFDFLDRLDPSYDAIAAKAGVCRRAVVNAVRRLKELGLLHWQRRCREDKDEAGRSIGP
jgi:CRP-like cAMP-binding protein